MKVKEKTKPNNNARFGLGRVNYPCVDYLFVKICKFCSCSLFRSATPKISGLLGGQIRPWIHGKHNIYA